MPFPDYLAKRAKKVSKLRDKQRRGKTLKPSEKKEIEEYENLKANRRQQRKAARLKAEASMAADEAAERAAGPPTAAPSSPSSPPPSTAPAPASASASPAPSPTASPAPSSAPPAEPSDDTPPALRIEEHDSHIDLGPGEKCPDCDYAEPAPPATRAAAAAGDDDDEERPRCTKTEGCVNGPDHEGACLKEADDDDEEEESVEGEVFENPFSWADGDLEAGFADEFSDEMEEINKGNKAAGLFGFSTKFFKNWFRPAARHLEKKAIEEAKRRAAVGGLDPDTAAAGTVVAGSVVVLVQRQRRPKPKAEETPQPQSQQPPRAQAAPQPSPPPPAPTPAPTPPPRTTTTQIPTRAPLRSARW